MTYFRYSRYAWACAPALAYAAASFPSYCETREHRSQGGRASFRHGGRASFGVRRPLRYLGYHLDLDESQMRRVAAILNGLKTEREQAELDERRTVAAVADLMTGEAPLPEELKAALAPRLDSAERLQREVQRAIQALYEALDADQRELFADLLRSGTISI